MLQDKIVYVYTQFLSSLDPTFFLRFYLFIHERHTERGRHTGRRRSRLSQGAQYGIQSLDQGSHPKPKADTQPLNHPGIP